MYLLATSLCDHNCPNCDPKWMGFLKLLNIIITRNMNKDHSLSLQIPHSASNSKHPWRWLLPGWLIIPLLNLYFTFPSPYLFIPSVYETELWILWGDHKKVSMAFFKLEWQTMWPRNYIPSYFIRTPVILWEQNKSYWFLRKEDCL